MMVQLRYARQWVERPSRSDMPVISESYLTISLRLCFHSAQRMYHPMRSDWESVYVPRIINALTKDLATGGAATAQLFSVTGAALDPLDPTSAIQSPIGLIFYSIWETNDLIATSGGMPHGNGRTTYAGSFDYTVLNAGVERIRADRPARAYAHRFYQTTGKLQLRLVTLHNTLDPIVPFRHELNYAELVGAAGRSHFLTVLPVEGYGHCNFTSEQIFGAFALLVQQVSEER